MKLARKLADARASWPARQRLRALKRIIPRADVEAALACAGRGHRFCPRMPGWFLVWFVLALGLCCRDPYRQVYRWLVPRRGDGVPPRSTLCEARKRLGVAPLRRLAARVVRLLATHRTPGAFYRHYRLMAMDGFVVNLPDSPANARTFTKPRNGTAEGAFPQARVLALCELGTHVLWRWLIKPQTHAEPVMASHLIRSLHRDMLLLWDRGFLGYRNLKAVRDGGARLLARVKSNWVFRPLRVLADGSYLAKSYPSPDHRRRDQEGILVRILEYTLDDPGRPGSGQRHRLLTTLLDAALDPAPTLIMLYHERWEEESTFDELKTHLRERPVLRSQTPAGVVQELEALLLAHYVVRVLMHEAATAQGLDPRRLSFVGALRVLRCRLAECPADAAGRRAWHQELVAEVGEEVLPPRQDRVNPRVVRCPRIPWAKKKPEHRGYPQPTQGFAASIVMLH